MHADLRDERPGDADAIGALVTAAFAIAPYADVNEAAIVARLCDAGALTLSIVAMQRDAIVGHVAVSPVTVGEETTGWYGLAPLSVAPEQQRAGIGAALVRAVLERLDEIGARGSVLIGDPAYYARFGFAADPALTWRDAPAGIVQGIALRGSPPRGEIAYHSSFG
ncbi:hypothetical protein ASG29_05835 [Sphingomonas sp. Leaf412]|nr:hypothetical protein ASG29_05835 [Sphingomonas sp. Leaf412]